MFGTLQPLNQSQTNNQRNNAKHSERTVDKPPIERNLSDRSADKGKRNNCHTGDYSPLNHPFVAYRITKRTNKHQCNNQMRECQPIISVRQLRSGLIEFYNTFLNRIQKAKNCRIIVYRSRIQPCNRAESFQLSFHRESRYPRQH